MQEEPTKENYVGVKAKTCAIIVLFYPTFLTGLLLKSCPSLIVQLIAIGLLPLITYVTILIVQDYFWLRTTDCLRNRRKDLHIVKPLLKKGKTRKCSTK